MAGPAPLHPAATAPGSRLAVPAKIGACVILSLPWYETSEAKAKAVQVFTKIKQQFTI